MDADRSDRMERGRRTRWPVAVPLPVLRCPQCRSADVRVRAVRHRTDQAVLREHVCRACGLVFPTIGEQ